MMYIINGDSVPCRLVRNTKCTEFCNQQLFASNVSLVRLFHITVGCKLMEQSLWRSKKFSVIMQRCAKADSCSLTEKCV